MNHCVQCGEEWDTQKMKRCDGMNIEMFACNNPECPNYGLLQVGIEKMKELQDELEKEERFNKRLFKDAIDRRLKKLKSVDISKFKKVCGICGIALAKREGTFTNATGIGNTVHKDKCDACGDDTYVSTLLDYIN